MGAPPCAKHKHSATRLNFATYPLKMGESAAHTIDQTSTWRVGILFLCFGLVSLALDRLFDWLENLFKNRKGLLHTVYCLKNELLMLGAISLILTAVQVSRLHTQLGPRAPDLHWMPAMLHKARCKSSFDVRDKLYAAPWALGLFCWPACHLNAAA